MTKYTLKTVLFACLLFVPTTVPAQIPDGYYSPVDGKQERAVKTALFHIISDHTELTYKDLWTAFTDTDAKPNGKVWDMYSDNPNGAPAYEFTFITDQCGNYQKESDCYNREHSFPKSWFDDAFPMYTDLFHLYPTDGYVNGKRSNYPFGEVNAPSWTSSNGSKLGNNATAGYSKTVFEPVDAYKGDFARTYFYMVTCYEDKVANWKSTEAQESLAGNSYPAFKQWAIDVLLKWHRNDPVSQKEIDRNNVIYTLYQHNRNPYIDHPELVEYIWGDKMNETCYLQGAGIDREIDRHTIEICASDGCIVVKGCRPTLSIQVYDISGRTVAEENGADGLNSLPVSKGLYIVKAGAVITKVYVK
jgi:endonuclease I